MSDRAEDLPRVLTVEQAAEVLGVSRALAYEGVKDGGPIPAFRIGRRVLVPRQKLLYLLGETNGHAPDVNVVARVVAAREELEAGAVDEAVAILRDLEADLSVQRSSE